MTIPLQDLTFGSPLWLWGWLTLPLLAGLFIWAEKRADRRLRQLIRAPRLRAQLTGAASTGRRRWRYALLLLGLGGLITSMAEPRLGYETQIVRRQGLDLILLVDVSKSMLATDVLPNRLTRAKLAVQDAVRLLTGDRLGLVAFAGNAFLQAPLTIDYDAVLTASNELDTDLIPRGGTNIGAAIDLALEAFGKAEANNRAIILLSDGEPTSEDEQADGIKAAQAAAAGGVKIFTVGFGSTEGSLIPLGDKTGEFVREDDGTLVRSRLNQGNLTELAKITGGGYFPFTNGEATMRAVIQGGLGKIKTGEITAHENRKPIERYQWPLGAALLCLAASALVGERRKTRAPAAAGSVSSGARAVPVPRRTPGGIAPAVPTAVAVAMAALLLSGVFPGRMFAADPTPAAATTAPDSPTQNALDLYKNGKYEEAYKAFKRLAEKDPKAGGLQFDAGTSAYKSKQYDEAIQAFGNALASDDPALQAQSQYNFGNTLFRHGEEQKSRETKISDWKDAIKHYDDALNYLKTHKDEALAQNTVYNRDVVQKHLDEELKEKEKQDQKKDQKDQKQDQKQDQKKDQKQDKEQDQSQSQSKSDQKKGDQKQPDREPKDEEPQKQQQHGDGENQKGSTGSGSGNKPEDQQQNNPSAGEGQNNPTPQPNSQGKPDEKNDQNPQAGQKSDGKQDPAPQPDQSKGDQGQAGSQPPGDPPSDGDKSDPSSIPNQDKPRQRGDFQAQPGKPDKPQGQDKDREKGEKEGDELAQVEPGKMTPGQARALLEALKGEDDRVNLTERNRRNRDQAVTKDW